jgi:hypothetical protein
VYGNYSTYFEPPPDPECRQPPAHQILPCPRTADHIVISQATFTHAFGLSFMTEFVDKSVSQETKHRRIYELAHIGYKSLFRLKDQSEVAYVNDRTTNGVFANAKQKGGMTIGVHIRRGDLHPWQNEFHGDYIPLSRYTDAIDHILSSGRTSHPGPKSLMEALASAIPSHHKKAHHHISPAGVRSSVVLLASDDPTLYTDSELQPIIRAQDRIQLADKNSLQKLAPHRPAGPLDHVHGWEGGFYREQFFSLGRADGGSKKPPPRFILKGKNTHSEEYDRIGRDTYQAGILLDGPGVLQEMERERRLMPGPEVMALRALVGKAYLLDLTVLGKTDAVVCGVSSTACRIIGIMMGWEAVADGRWKNVDGAYGWQGVVVH